VTGSVAFSLQAAARLELGVRTRLERDDEMCPCHSTRHDLTGLSISSSWPSRHRLRARERPRRASDAGRPESPGGHGAQPLGLGRPARRLPAGEYSPAQPPWQRSEGCCTCEYCVAETDNDLGVNPSCRPPAGEYSPAQPPWQRSEGCGMCECCVAETDKHLGISPSCQQQKQKAGQQQ
jgi:hypothetical protein